MTWTSSTVLLIALGFLLPSLVTLINSVADRNRAADNADVIRARRGRDTPTAGRAPSSPRRCTAQPSRYRIENGRAALSTV